MDVWFYFLVVYTLTGKPNSLHDSADGEEDGEFIFIYLFLFIYILFIFIYLIPVFIQDAPLTTLICKGHKFSEVLLKI